MALVSKEISDSIDALERDPIIIGMAEGVADDADVTAWSFILAASRVYIVRGGTADLTIGGPAEAIKRLLAE